MLRITATALLFAIAQMIFMLKRLALLATAAGLALPVLAITPYDGTTGNGSLILNAVDETTKVSYVFDTGLRLNDFQGSSSLSFNLGSDPNWQTFEGQITNGDYVRYNVVAWASVASPTNFVALTTTNATATQGSTTSGNVGFTNNNALKQATASENAFMNALNVPLNSSSNPNTNLNSAYIQQATYDPGYFGDSFQDRWNTKFSFDSTDNIGTPLNFYELQLTAPYTSNLQKVTLTAFSGQWDLTSGGLLTYTPVPETDSMLSVLTGIVGLLALGLKRGARRKQMGKQSKAARGKAQTPVLPTSVCKFECSI